MGALKVGGRLSSSFAERLNRLFDEVRGPGGRRWENREVVEAVNAAGRAKISPSYLSELRTGKKDNPNIWAVKALADFFGQTVDYFVGDEPPAAPTGRPSNADATSTTTFGQRLNLLFRLVGEPSNAQVAADVAQTTAGRLAGMRAGEIETPTSAELEGLAGYFGVPRVVLAEPEVAAILASSLPGLELLRDDSVRRIALRAQALSDRDRAFVVGLLARLAGEDAGEPAEELDF